MAYTLSVRYAVRYGDGEGSTVRSRVRLSLTHLPTPRAETFGEPACASLNLLDFLVVARVHLAVAELQRDDGRRDAHDGARRAVNLAEHDDVHVDKAVVQLPSATPNVLAGENRRQQ